MSLIRWLVVFAVTVPALAAGPTTRPSIQLTAPIPRHLDDGSTVADITLRELNRQAILIAARDELGLRTRDMALDEPFDAGTATVLIDSQIKLHGKAMIGLARFTGQWPANPYDLADQTIDGPTTMSSAVDRISYDTPGEVLPDYPAFVSKCEQLSRTDLPDWLRKQGLIAPADERPVAWVDAGAIGNEAAVRLGRFDVFNQYLAVRSIHDQMAMAGASPQRLAGLVRGYANLSRLTRRQWSFASKAFSARSLLYAERLVVHDHHSTQALYTRAYARALAGLHKAALDDLAAADKAGSARPPIALLTDAVCRFDLSAITDAFQGGPHAYRAAAASLTLSVAADYNSPTASAAVDQVNNSFPELLQPRSGGSEMGYRYGRFNAAESVLGAVPVVLEDALSDASLPAEVVPAVGRLTPWQNGVHSVADLFTTLNQSAPNDPHEPSVGVLAGLILQQEFLGLLDQPRYTYNFGLDEQSTADQLFKTAAVVVDAHPWGPLIARCTNRNFNGNNANNANEPAKPEDFQKAMSKVRPRHAGPWLANVGDYIRSLDGESDKVLQSYINDGRRLSDQTGPDVSEYNRGWSPAGLEPDRYMLAVRRTSPYSADLFGRFLAGMGSDRMRSDDAGYTETMADVQSHFIDRPDVVARAAEWSDARADFKRSFDLLSRANDINPSSTLCHRLAKLAHHNGDENQATMYIDRAVESQGNVFDAVRYSTIDPDENTPVLTKADWLCATGHAAAAVDLIHAHADEQNNTRILTTLARSLELSGHPDDAASTLRMAAAIDPSMVRKQYAFARRLDRPEAADVKKAALAANQPDSVDVRIQLHLIDGERKQAFDLAKKNLPSINYWTAAEAVILAAEFHDPATIKSVAEQSKPADPAQTEFARIFKDLTTGTDQPAALAAFDQFQSRQLNEYLLCVRESIVGRYLIAVGRKDLGVRYLNTALARPQRETDAYFHAWQAMRTIDAGQ